MKRRTTGMLILLTLSAGLSYWYAGRKDASPAQVEVSKKSPLVAVKAPLAVLPKPIADKPPNPVAMPRLLSFSSDDGMARLQSVIQDASGFADNEARQSAFAKSGEDTTENFQAALALLSQAYTEPVSKSQARQKVLALHFLQLTAQFDSINVCASTLDAMEESLRRALQEKTKLALAVDARDLATICLDVDEESFRAHVETRPDSIIKQQIIAQIGDNS